MPVTTQDILTDEDAVSNQLEQVAEERAVIRNAFRGVNLSNANSGTVYFVVPEDDNSEVETVEGGAEFPRHASDRNKVACVRDKYGEEYPLTYEAESDGIFDDMAIESRSQMTRLARTLDTQAFNVLSANVNATSAGDNGGSLSFADLVEAERVLMEDPFNYEPDSIFVGPTGMADLKLSNEFTSDVDAIGERNIREGLIGSILGMDVFLSTTANIGANDAYMVDTSKYGREGQWELPNSRVYEEENKQVKVQQFWTLLGWASTQSDAAALVQG